MVRAEQVANGVMAYAEAEVLPALDGMQLWMASAALVLARQRADLLLVALVDNKMVSALGLVDADGMIDVDAAIAALKQTAQRHGKLTLDIPGLGKIRLGEEDFDALREHIAQAGA